MKNTLQVIDNAMERLNSATQSHRRKPVMRSAHEINLASSMLFALVWGEVLTKMPPKRYLCDLVRVQSECLSALNLPLRREYSVLVAYRKAVLRHTDYAKLLISHGIQGVVGQIESECANKHRTAA